MAEVLLVILAFCCISGPSRRRNAASLTEGHLLRGALEMCLKDDLAIDVNYELVHWLVKELVGIVHVVHVDLCGPTQQWTLMIWVRTNRIFATHEDG
jgi:hypothetical protein